ncbi:hypothetical protein [Klebsiella aerogenes]|uniref:hypothetical protein n=1 Tax=Klebsiella aerogenes TaxID=548 RepID=UPI00292D07A2|nr:hypothetical protein [Klebsiella aerogenes]
MYRKMMVLIFIYTVFGFKLSLLGGSGDDQGGGVLSSIRIDDIVILIFVILYFLKGNTGGFFLSKKPVFFFLIYFGISIVSTIYNTAFGEVDFVSSLLFSLRPLEYFIYIALGYELARMHFSPETVLKVYVIYCLVLIAGQSLGLISGISSFSSNRAIANTGGPWELAAVSAFIMFYFFMKKDPLYSALSLLILVLTQSRITLAASILVLCLGNFHYITTMLKRKNIILGLFAVVGLSFTYALYSLTSNNITSADSTSSGVTARFEAFGNNDTLTTLNDILANTGPANNRQDYFDKTYGSKLNAIITDAGSGDASALIRFTRWVTLVKTASNDAVSLFIGLGPSYASKAVDGNYIRIFVETGLLGLLSYLIFIISGLRNIKQKLLINYIWILAITASFIDIFVTFKAMFFFWFFYGYYIYNQKNVRIDEA